ncbi:hypothetical protein [Crassaminicella profunda]|uniref:hypothetical protein n=1 Tax=Crassaminicella profunda TaxID=1286698 RepID=UPI001CA754E7|nr:hypothetical protein [Crassaminicella profunda]QZY57180.1 hypothetical protein K7H06_09780 [Crassaminicella profunda]
MYKLNSEKNVLEKISESTFVENELKERDNIEEWIRKEPTVLGEELIIIGHEYDKFEVNERLDLLALDKDGNLVIIEVKRDKTGGNVDFQALKYCSYCSTLNPSEIIEVYDEYLKKFNINESALENIMDFLEVDSEDLLNGILNTGQRIVIIGKEIDKRILSVCAWLSQNNIDIKCMSIIPYKLDSLNNVIVDINQLIPTYSIDDYFINKKKIEKSKGKLVQPDKIVEFFNNIVSMAKSRGHKAYYNSRKTYAKIYSEVDGKLVFALGYRKREGTFRLELSARNDKSSKQLLETYNKNKERIESRINYPTQISEGVRNSNWLRVFIDIEYDKNSDLLSYADKVGMEFIKFVELFKEVL